MTGGIRFLSVTAALAALVFLDVNGIETLPAPEELERETLSVAAGRAMKDALTSWLRGEVP